MGQARVVQSHKFLIHKINLQELIDGTVNFQRAINKLERNIDSGYAIDSLSTKVGQLQARVEKLLPMSRQKRGLINGLGNVIKIVTGNLDDSDGRRIEDSLKTISENQKDLTVNVNKQEGINNDILTRFDNITEHINREQQIINNFLNSYRDSTFKTLKAEHHLLHTMQYASRINMNLDILLDHVKNIEDSLLYAKLKIVPTFIVSAEEIDMIRKELNDPELRELSDENIFQMLDLDTFMIGVKIHFRIRIPTFKQHLYKFTHIIPLPINGSKFLIVPNYMAYLNAKEVYYFSDVCNKIHKYYICENSMSIKDDVKAECLSGILTLETARCKTKDIGSQEIITEVEPAHILILNTQNTVIESNCTTTIAIKGSALVTFENCKVWINQIPYDKEISSYEEKLDAHIPIIKNINFTESTEDINLQKLNLRSIHASNSIIYWKNFTTTNLGALYILLVVGVAVTTILIYTRRRVEFTTIPEPSFVTTTPSLWPSLQSGRGGVTGSNRHTDPPAKPPRLTLELVQSNQCINNGLN